MELNIIKKDHPAIIRAKAEKIVSPEMELATKIFQIMNPGDCLQFGGISPTNVKIYLNRINERLEPEERKTFKYITISDIATTEKKDRVYEFYCIDPEIIYGKKEENNPSDISPSGLTPVSVNSAEIKNDDDIC